MSDGTAAGTVRPPHQRAGQLRDLVTVRLPADSAYLSVLRTATAGLAARLDFTLDEIEDLRIAVDEACAMLLPQAVGSDGLVCSFELVGDSLLITVSVPTKGGELPARDTFSWTVLQALAGEVDAGIEGRSEPASGPEEGALAGAGSDPPATDADDEQIVWIRLKKRRAASGTA